MPLIGQYSIGERKKRFNELQKHMMPGVITG